MKKLYTVLFAVLMALTIHSVAYADDGMSDDAYYANNPDYRVSDSPYLRMPDDMLNWPDIVAPEPFEAEGMEDPTALEVHNVATGETIQVASDDPTQQPVESDSTSAPAYQGLLPPGIVLEPESVFPPDDRVRVTSVTSYPWRTIVNLYITHPGGGTGGCSGAIIDGYHVMTAGHCVYLHDENGWPYDSWASSIRVIPGQDHDYMPYNEAWATYLRSYTGWTVSRDHRHDWAVITLDRNVGNFVGWMGRVTAGSGDSIYTGIANTAGYPCNFYDPTTCPYPKTPTETMWFDSDYGRTADEYNHWYYMDTQGGQSGSPVWWYDGASRYIMTVHAYGDDGSSSNHGTRLNQDKFDRIFTWLAEDTPPTDYADLIDDGQTWSGFSPTTVVRGTTSFDVWSDVRNVGTASSGGFDVCYYASTNTAITTSDYLIGCGYVSSISPFSWRDSSWSGTFPAGIPGGTYWVGWIIDRYDDVTEFNELNNTAYKDSYQLTVVDPPTPTRTPTKTNTPTPTKTRTPTPTNTPITPTKTSTPTPTKTPVTPTPTNTPGVKNTIAVVPANSGAVGLGATFTVEVHVTDAQLAYTAVDAQLEWEAAGLEHVSNTPGTMPGGILLFPGMSVVGSGDPPGTEQVHGMGGLVSSTPVVVTGKLWSVELRCEEKGEYTLHLVPVSEDPVFGTATAAVAGVPQPMVLKDGQVTCGCTPPFTAIVPGDTDCDAAYDNAELGPDPFACGTRDPNNPWDFYDVPAPTLFNGGSMNNRDSAVSIIKDVLAVLEYTGISPAFPCNGGPDLIPGTPDDRCYNQDRDGDGVDDGVAYDRSSGAVWSGPPNGAISVLEDVLLVLAQTGASCPP